MGVDVTILDLEPLDFTEPDGFAGRIMSSLVMKKKSGNTHTLAQHIKFQIKLEALLACLEAGSMQRHMFTELNRNQETFCSGWYQGEVFLRFFFREREL